MSCAVINAEEQNCKHDLDSRLVNARGMPGWCSLWCSGNDVTCKQGDPPDPAETAAGSAVAAPLSSQMTKGSVLKAPRTRRSAIDDGTYEEHAAPPTSMMLSLRPPAMLHARPRKRLLYIHRTCIRHGHGSTDDQSRLASCAYCVRMPHTNLPDLNDVPRSYISSYRRDAAGA